MTKKKETICFLIFAVGKANGGHYRSLRAIAETLSQNYNIIIINIGFTYSPIIANSNLDSHFIFFNGINVFQTLKNIKKTIDVTSIDYIHSFDYLSLLIGRILSKSIKRPCIFTKCGGPSPKGYYPFAKYMTVFSMEDYQYFKKNKKYENSVIKLIPNRVNEFSSNDTKIQLLINKYGLKNKVIFLRICRISEYYYKSIKQSINLINELSVAHPQIVLLVIGNIQDKVTLNKINNELSINSSVISITDDEFTLNAKELIEISDFVIGTGRGFMEACSKRKVLLTPSNNSEFPILINDDNFEIAFVKNFSERIIFNRNDIDNNIKLIDQLLESPTDYEIACKNSYDWFVKFFSIENAKNQYIQLYNNSSYCKDNIIDLFIHFLFVLKKNIGNSLKFLFNK